MRAVVGMQAKPRTRATRQRKRSKRDVRVRQFGERLTDKESEIESLLVDGLKFADISKRLNRKPNTIKVHVKRIYLKRGVHSHIQLIKRAEAARAPTWKTPNCADNSPPPFVPVVGLHRFRGRNFRRVICYWQPAGKSKQAWFINDANAPGFPAPVLYHETLPEPRLGPTILGPGVTPEEALNVMMKSAAA